MIANTTLRGPAKTCTATGQPLEPGTRFMAVLRDEHGQWLREDYSLDAWPGPPADAVAYWQGRVPTRAPRQKLVIHDAVLWGCFDHLATTTTRDGLQFRYVLALLLMRRKQLNFEDLQQDGQGQEFLLLRDRRNGQCWAILDPRLTEEELVQVQHQLLAVLAGE